MNGRRLGSRSGVESTQQPGADPAAFLPAFADRLGEWAGEWLLVAADGCCTSVDYRRLHQSSPSTLDCLSVCSPSTRPPSPTTAAATAQTSASPTSSIGRPVQSGPQDSRSAAARLRACSSVRVAPTDPAHPHPHPDPAIPVSSSRPISISTQISHSKSGHSDAALRLNPPPSRNTSALPPLRNKRALAMPWAWTSSPTAMASSSSSSCSSPSSSAYASFARAASVLLSSTTKTTAYLALVALCLPMALGHDHSVENIPDGDATSPEPIVRQTISPAALVLCASTDC